MAFRLVNSGGSVIDPAMVSIYASGVVRPGMVVDFSRTGGQGAIPGSSGSTFTTIIGVCLDYAQGGSDVKVRVIPFVQGQIWEADCVNTVDTSIIGFRQELYNVAGAQKGSYLANSTYNNSGAAGIFMVWDITGATTGSGKVLGEFIRIPIHTLNGTTFNN